MICIFTCKVVMDVSRIPKAITASKLPSSDFKQKDWDFFGDENQCVLSVQMSSPSCAGDSVRIPQDQLRYPSGIPYVIQNAQRTL